MKNIARACNICLIVIKLKSFNIPNDTDYIKPVYVWFCYLANRSYKYTIYCYRVPADFQKILHRVPRVKKRSGNSATGSEQSIQSKCISIKLT